MLTPHSRSRPYFVRNVGTAARAREPLVYVHGDFDGGGLYCLSLASHLGLDQPLYALNPHGMNGEPLPESIHAMAAAHLETVRKLLPGKAYRLAGHCNGGLIAFEMARQLVARGIRVDRLIVIAARADYWKVKPLAGTRTYYAERLRHWWKLDPPARRRDIVRAARARGLAVMRRFARPATDGLPNLSPPKEHGSALFQAYRRVMAAYRPGRYSGALTLLWPAEEVNLRRADPTMGWSRVAPRVEVERVPGGHLTCLTTHAAALAAALRRHLDGRA
jgi:thioesterase domain-containing protein